MKGKSLETELIQHCAPTLAGMKSASLFHYFYEEAQSVKDELKKINVMLNDKGVYVKVLLWRESSALIYVYRTAMLKKEFSQPGVRELLKEYGYPGQNIDSCLKNLEKRLSNYTCFPHEIGIFLGYPLEDVKGFIENEGKNCQSCGMWKVYCNREEKDKFFGKLKKCTEVYLRVFGEGRELSQMTVYT